MNFSKTQNRELNSKQQTVTASFFALHAIHEEVGRGIYHENHQPGFVNPGQTLPEVQNTVGGIKSHIKKDRCPPI